MSSMSDMHPQILFIMADLSNVAAVAGTGVNPWVSAGLGIASFGYNHWMYNKQKDFNVEMWNMQNEYNKPVNQKQRLLEAGMNPLYYGLDGNSAGTPQAAPTPQYTDPIQAASVASNLANMKAQTNLTNEQAKGLAIENKYKEDEITKNLLYRDNEIKLQGFEIRIQASNAALQEQFGYDERKKNLDVLDEQIKTYVQNLKILAEDYKMKKIDSKYYNELQRLMREKYRVDNNHTRKLIEQINQQIEQSSRIFENTLIKSYWDSEQSRWDAAQKYNDYQIDLKTKEDLNNLGLARAIVDLLMQIVKANK